MGKANAIRLVDRGGQYAIILHSGKSEVYKNSFADMTKSLAIHILGGSVHKLLVGSWPPEEDLAEEREAR
eukprot:5730222-Amphidinium_carterae.1